MEYGADRATTESSPLRILFVAILREPKGLISLIEACALLQLRGSPFELAVAGDFESPEFATQARHRIAELGVSAHVRFLGVIQGDAKSEAFAWADVFCLPTYHESETFPTVLLEAMSFGLPVVATRWAAFRKLWMMARLDFW